MLRPCNELLSEQIGQLPSRIASIAVIFNHLEEYPPPDGMSKEGWKRATDTFSRVLDSLMLAGAGLQYLAEPDDSIGASDAEDNRD